MRDSYHQFIDRCRTNYDSHYDLFACILRKKFHIYPLFIPAGRRYRCCEGTRRCNRKVIVCFSARARAPCPSSEISSTKPFCAWEKRRSEPCHVFRMNLHDDPPWTYVTFCPCTCAYTHDSRVRVCVCVCAGRPACGQRFPAAADVGPSSRGPLEIRNSVWLYPICPPWAGPYHLARFFVWFDLRYRVDDTTHKRFLRSNSVILFNATDFNGKIL